MAEIGYDSQRMQDQIDHGLQIMEEIGCEKKYVDTKCDSCPFIDFEMVSHPGGESHSHKVERHWCTLDFWEERF